MPNYLLVLDREGRVTSSFSATVKSLFTPARLGEAKSKGFNYTKRSNVKPGLYQVRLGVREESSNAMGTAAAWVDVPDLRNKRLALSDLPRTHQRTIPDEVTQLRIGEMLFRPDAPIFYRFRN